MTCHKHLHCSGMTTRIDILRIERIGQDDTPLQQPVGGTMFPGPSSNKEVQPNFSWLQSCTHQTHHKALTSNHHTAALPRKCRTPWHNLSCWPWDADIHCGWAAGQLPLELWQSGWQWTELFEFPASKEQISDGSEWLPGGLSKTVLDTQWKPVAQLPQLLRPWAWVHVSVAEQAMLVGGQPLVGSFQVVWHWHCSFCKRSQS